MTVNIVSDFYESPADKRALACRSSVFGIGTNDADYLTSPQINGRTVNCPYYSVWSSMLRRCYSKVTQARQPAYIGCETTKEWHLFSNFKSWMKNQDWQRKQLDKDLIIPGNKIYSPDTCIFIDQRINKLLTNHKAKRGKFPQGVSWHKRNEVYAAQMNSDGNHINLGYYNTEEEAESVYKKAKSNEIMRCADMQIDQVLRFALARHAILMAG